MYSGIARKHDSGKRSMIQTKQKKTAAQRAHALVLAIFFLFWFPISSHGAEFHGMDQELPWNETNLETLYVKGTLNYFQSRKAFHLVNAARLAAGASPLELDAKLQRAAMRRAAEIALRYSHERPDGTICNTISNRLNGENIAKGKAVSFDGNAVVQTWTSLPEDFKHMVNKAYRSTGVGCFSHNGTNYWVQTFGLEPATDAPEAKKNRTVSAEIHVKIDTVDIAFAESGATAWGKGRNGELPIVATYESAKPHPLKVEPKSFRWKSSKKSVISVNAQGTLTGKRLGSASIKATLPVSGKQITKKVTVVKPPKKVYIKSAWKNDDFLRVKWKKVRKADAYEVLVARDKNFTKGRRKLKVSGNKRSAAFHGLQKSKGYYVKVRAIRVIKGTKVRGAYSKAEKAER